MRHAMTDRTDDMDEDTSYVDIGGERLRVMTRQHDPLLEEERRHDRVLMALLPDYKGFDKEPVKRRSRGRVAAPTAEAAPKRSAERKHSLKCRRYMKRIARAHGMGSSFTPHGRGHQ